MTNDDSLAYSQEVAGSLQQPIANVLEEHWGRHLHDFANKPDAVLTLFRLLAARLPGGVGEQLNAALQQWAHAVAAQYDATLALTRGYARGVETLVETDRQLGRRSPNPDGY